MCIACPKKTPILNLTIIYTLIISSLYAISTLTTVGHLLQPASLQSNLAQSNTLCYLSNMIKSRYDMSLKRYYANTVWLIASDRHNIRNHETVSEGAQIMNAKKKKQKRKKNEKNNNSKTPVDEQTNK